MPIELNHKTLSEAINFHETWFEYHVNMAHMAHKHVKHPDSEPYHVQITKAAHHAAILQELRRHAETRVP